MVVFQQPRFNPLKWLPYGHFTSTRGLRQGDLLLPYLFIIGSEILSKLLLREEYLSNLKGITLGRGGPHYSHLSFANDLILLDKATIHEARVFKHCLSKYLSWTGQSLNSQKSSIYFNKNVSSQLQLTLLNILGIHKSATKATHLGLPLLFTRLKFDAFSSIKHKIATKLVGWKAKLLSQAGRTQLIKSAATSIPSYYMLSYALPKSHCISIEKMLKDFW